MDTFYCNFCLHPLNVFQGGKGDSFMPSSPIKSYITNCQHTFCQTCKEKCREKCAVCGNVCKLMEINESMPFHLRLMFQPLHTTQNLLNTVWKFQGRQEAYSLRKLKHMENFFLSKYDEEKRQYQLEANALKRQVEMNGRMNYLHKYHRQR